MRSDGERLESVFMLAFRLDFKRAASIWNSPRPISFLADHSTQNFPSLRSQSDRRSLPSDGDGFKRSGRFLNKETSLANSSIYSPFINTLLQQGGRRWP